MDRRKYFVILLVSLGVLLTAQTAQTAQPIKASTPTPSIDNWCCDWTVMSSRQFVWMRLQPASDTVTATVFPGQPISAVNEPLQWDGAQWWGKVKLPLSETYGWVETAFLQRYGGIYNTDNQSKANWTVGSAVRVRSNIKFVWMSNAASHHGTVVLELPAGTTFAVARDAQRDTVQWWWSVRHSKTGLVGWIEQTSLEAAPDVVIEPTPAPQAWIVGSTVQVRTDIPFAWLRNNPLAWAQPSFTVKPGAKLEIIAQPQYADGDGQWWVAVNIPGTSKSGFVEQKSLILIEALG